VATTPWDSYLIRRAIWTYPSSVILGPRLWGIPAEEYFFFVVQTYITSLLYLLLGKSSVKATGLRAHSKDRRQEAQSKTNPNSQTLAKTHILKQAVIAAGILYSVYLVYHGGSGTYMGLIGVWAGPFFFLLHGLAHQLWENLPWKDTAIPILLPTIYLWLVDTLALRRGTWSIGSATILGIYVWPALEIEEAVFFLATNALVVFGMLAFDKALAVLQLFPHLFPEAPALPTPLLLIRALLVGTDEYDADRISGLQEAVKRLRSKSRSFYLASSVFEGRLRLDLIRL
jgi:15-cis-phytoene synthase/lycopene beta-cyclase